MYNFLNKKIVDLVPFLYYVLSYPKHYVSTTSLNIVPEKRFAILGIMHSYKIAD